MDHDSNVSFVNPERICDVLIIDFTDALHLKKVIPAPECPELRSPPFHNLITHHKFPGKLNPPILLAVLEILTDTIALLDRPSRTILKYTS